MCCTEKMDGDGWVKDRIGMDIVGKGQEDDTQVEREGGKLEDEKKRKEDGRWGKMWDWGGEGCVKKQILWGRKKSNKSPRKWELTYLGSGVVLLFKRVQSPLSSD